MPPVAGAPAAWVSLKESPRVALRAWVPGERAREPPVAEPVRPVGEEPSCVDARREPRSRI